MRKSADVFGPSLALAAPSRVHWQPVEEVTHWHKFEINELKALERAR